MIKPIFSVNESDTVMAIVDYRNGYTTVWFTGYNSKVCKQMRNIGTYNKEKKLWYVVHNNDVVKKAKIKHLREILKNLPLVVEMENGRISNVISPFSD